MFGLFNTKAKVIAKGFTTHRAGGGEDSFALMFKSELWSRYRGIETKGSYINHSKSMVINSAGKMLENKAEIFDK